MGKLIVDVKEPNKAISYRNRIVRSPVTFEIYENELKLLKGQLRQLGIEDYVVKPYAPPVEVDTTFDEVLLQNDEEVIVEDLCEELEEPKTILDRLIKDNS